jgi:hypothetical protein
LAGGAANAAGEPNGFAGTAAAGTAQHPASLLPKRRSKEEEGPLEFLRLTE